MRIAIRLLGAVVFTWLLVAAPACETYRNCPAGECRPCTCPDGEAGFATCEADGSGYGPCRCGCLDSCQDAECGQIDDNCGGFLDCGSCGANENCSLDLTCECAFELCAGSCCARDETCVQGVCRSGGCCPDQYQHIWVAGQVTDFVTGDAVSVDLIVLGILPALTEQLDERLAGGESDGSGNFYLDCMDVSETSLGLYLLTHESDENGPTGRYLLTINPLVEWRTNDEKQCASGARAVAITTEIFEALQAGLPQVDLEQEGFIVGKVLDANLDPVTGARVAPADDAELPPVFYPDPSFVDFSSSVTTSSGVYVIPGKVDLTQLTAEKDGYSWANAIQTVGSVSGVAFHVDFVAD